MKQIIPTNYEEYRRVQVEANRRKHDNTWAREAIISDLATKLPPTGQGICHGIRNGDELRFWAAHTPGWGWTGTDIAPAEGSNVAQVDFHAKAHETFGCVYSNSLDHSPFPAYAVSVWLQQLALHGTLFIEWSEGHFPGRANEVDVFGATYKELEGFLRLCGHLVGTYEYQDRRVYALRPFEGGR